MLNSIVQVHLDNLRSPGDILAFLTGQEEIEDLAQLLEQKILCLSDLREVNV